MVPAITDPLVVDIVVEEVNVVVKLVVWLVLVVVVGEQGVTNFSIDCTSSSLSCFNVPSEYSSARTAAASKCRFFTSSDPRPTTRFTNRAMVGSASCAFALA